MAAETALSEAIPTGYTAGFSGAVVNSIAMIIATELGDKTFCIAALMAMRYTRLFVYTGALGALVVMTILSVGIGVAVPTLLPKVYTHYAAAALFAYFGYKLLREASSMPAGENGHDELEEAEQELGFVDGDKKEEDGVSNEISNATAPPLSSPLPSGPLPSSSPLSSPPLSSTGATALRAPSDHALDTTVDAEDPEADARRKARSRKAGASTAPVQQTPVQQGVQASVGLGSWVSKLSPGLTVELAVLTQAFTLTFLAEWGDRSQIATIAMAAAQNPFGICFGAIVGHALCTGLAVIGGRMLASRISERTVAWIGGVLFVLFALHSVIAGPDVD